MSPLLIFSAFFLSVLITRFTIYAAHYFNFLDKPITALKTQKKPVAYMGGVAIFSAFSIVFLFLNNYSLSNGFFLINIGLFFLLLLGLFDDKYPIKPLCKLMGQVLIIFIFMLPIIYIAIPWACSTFRLVLIGFWILVVINSINLIDIMDGLAPVTVVGVLCNLLILSLIQGNFLAAHYFLVWIGAILGFLCFNLPPAQIYLGDAGSLMLGGLLGTSSLLLMTHPKDFLEFLIPMILLAIPLLECAFLILIRSYKGIPFYLGSPDHFAHYLKRKNWTIRKILFFVLMLTIILGLASLAIFYNKVTFLELFFNSLMFLIAWVFIVYL